MVKKIDLYSRLQKIVLLNLSTKNVSIKNKRITFHCSKWLQSDIMSPFNCTVKSVRANELILTDGYYDYNYIGIGAIMNSVRAIGNKVGAGERVGISKYGVDADVDFFITDRNGNEVDVDMVLMGDVYQRPNDFATRQEVLDIYNYLYNNNKKNGTKNQKK